MMKLPEINRHVAGVSALALALLGLGYWANMTSDNRRVASLSETAPGIAMTAPEPSFNTNFLSMLGRTPPNAYGSAGSAASDLNAAGSRQSAVSLKGSQAAVSPSGSRSTEGSIASKDWSADDWRTATEAVAKARSSAKGQPANKQAANTGASGIIWQPPEEIAAQSNGSR